MGRAEKRNGSVVTTRWSEGPIEGKVADLSIGYFLLSIFAGVDSAQNADASEDVYDHTFEVTNDVQPHLTVGVKNPAADRRYPTCAASSVEISSEAGGEGGYVMFTAEMVGGDKASASNTVAYVDENEFTGAHVTNKIAEDLAGLGAADALETRSMRLTLSRAKTPFVPHGSKVPVEHDQESFEATGELVLRYKDTDLEDLWYDNTVRALSIAIVNDDVTIGTSANPGLVFTMPQVTLETHDKTTELDSYVEQTVSFYAEVSADEGHAIEAILTNLQATYVAA
jgi:hypothetical protein